MGRKRVYVNHGNCVICNEGVYRNQITHKIDTKRNETLFIHEKCWNEIPKKGDKHDNTH